MSVFTAILMKLIPLYFIILLGFISGRILGTPREVLGKILIYIITPVVIFYGTYTADITLANLSLPVIVFCISSTISILFYFIGKYFYGEDTTKNILAFTAGTGNTGYFGLPAISATLGDGAFSIAVLSILGVVLYENTIGFYITAKGNFTGKQSLKKIIRLPTIYAFLFGIILNISGIELGEIIENTVNQFKGAYTIFGMMIIGVGLASVKVKYIDAKFIGLTFLAKFLISPILIIGFIFLDMHFLNLYDTSIYQTMILLSIVPLAANTVAIATELKAQPEKSAIAVLLSTLFALVYIPLIITVYF